MSLTITDEPGPNVSALSAPQFLTTVEVARQLHSQPIHVLEATQRGLLRWQRGKGLARLYAREDVEAARCDLTACNVLRIAPDGALPTREAIRILGVSHRTLTNYALQGMLTPVRIGRFHFWWAAEVDQLAARRCCQLRPPHLRDYLTFEEAMSRLGVGKRTMFRYRDNGLLHSVRWRGRIFFDPAEADPLRVSAYRSAQSKRGGETLRRLVDDGAPPGMISSPRAAACLGLTLTGVLALGKTGKLQSVVVNHHRYFLEAAVLERAAQRAAEKARRAAKPNRRSTAWIAQKTALARLGVSQMALLLHDEAGNVITREPTPRRYLYLKHDVRLLAKLRCEGALLLEQRLGAIDEAEALGLLDCADYLLASFRRSNVLTVWENGGRRHYWRAEVLRLREFV